MLSTVVGAKSRTAGFKRLFLMGVPLLGLMLLAAKPVEAASASANIVLRTTVTISVSLVAGNTWFNFGEVSAAATRISDAPIIFRNDSVGAVCRWDLNIEPLSLAPSVGAGVAWTLGTAPGADQAALFALISTFTPTAAMFVHTSTLSTTAKEYNSINFFNASYNPHGHLNDASKILPHAHAITTGQSADRRVWLKLQTPTLVTDTNWRTLRLRVTAKMAS